MAPLPPASALRRNTLPDLTPRHEDYDSDSDSDDEHDEPPTRPTGASLHKNTLVQVRTQLQEKLNAAATAVDDDEPDATHDALVKKHATTATTADPTRTAIPTGKLSKDFKEQFVRDHLPTKIQTQLNQPFGKDNLDQCFMSAATLDHILLPVLKSGYITRTDRTSFKAASNQASTMSALLKEHRHVDFSPLQGYNRDPKWNERTTIDEERKRMTTACALHFDLDIPSVVRWIGGPHVGAHRDHNAILRELKPILEPQNHADLTRVFLQGSPSKCNAFADSANYQAYRKYGNHKTIDEHMEKVRKTMAKEARNDFVLTLDPALIDFVPNAHVTPLGVVNVDTKPRCVFDSTMRPEKWCSGINDWHTNLTEPTLIFPTSFLLHLTWILNLRISYPRQELFNGDDDASSAFRWVKYHPNLVALHSFLIDGTLMMATGQTFGDKGCPANWEAIAKARQALAQHLWNDNSIVERAQAEYSLPSIALAPSPTPDESATFVQINADALNPGVFLPDGTRIAPGYHHHVDDNMYADVKEHIVRTLASSVVAIYTVLGKPDGRFADPLARDKLTSMYSHLRRILGWEINTRSLMVSLPQDKRDKLIAALEAFLAQATYQILEAAELHGLLSTAAQVSRKGRALFFNFQNAIRDELRLRHQQVTGYYKRSKREKMLQAELPLHLHKRTENLIALEIATLLWKSRANIKTTERVRDELNRLLTMLKDPTYLWQMSIAHIVPRTPHFIPTGDSSELAGGAHCKELECWFTALWSDRLRQAIQLPHKDPSAVHINLLEYIVVILELAMGIVALEDATHMTSLFPSGDAPTMPVLLIRSDNMVSVNWTNNVSAKSTRGQMFVHIYAELLERTNAAVRCEHIPGDMNGIADDMSRPSTHLSNFEFHKQLCHKHDFLQSWMNFQPSPDLVSLLQSRLYCSQWPGPPVLPKSLGRLVPASSISSYSCTL